MQPRLRSRGDALARREGCVDLSATGNCSVSKADSSGIAAKATPAISPASDCILVVDQPVYGMGYLSGSSCARVRLMVNATMTTGASRHPFVRYRAHLLSFINLFPCRSVCRAFPGRKTLFRSAELSFLRLQWGLLPKREQ